MIVEALPWHLNSHRIVTSATNNVYHLCFNGGVLYPLPPGTLKMKTWFTRFSLALFVALSVFSISGMAPAAAAPPAQATSYTKYVVRKGDTLSALAKRYGVTVAAIRNANGLSSSRIYVGQVLSIPTSRGRVRTPVPPQTPPNPVTGQKQNNDGPTDTPPPPPPTAEPPQTIVPRAMPSPVLSTPTPQPGD